MKIYSKAWISTFRIGEKYHIQLRNSHHCKSNHHHPHLHHLQMESSWREISGVSCSSDFEFLPHLEFHWRLRGISRVETEVGSHVCWWFQNEGGVEQQRRRGTSFSLSVSSSMLLLAFSPMPSFIGACFPTRLSLLSVTFASLPL